MTSHLVFNGVDDAVKARLETYWAKKLSRVQKLLVPYPADLQGLADRQPSRTERAAVSRYEVRAVVHLPTEWLRPRQTTMTRRSPWTGCGHTHRGDPAAQGKARSVQIYAEESQPGRT